MSSITDLLIGDVLALMQDAGERIIYHRAGATSRDPATREITQAPDAAVHMPAALLQWRTSRPAEGAPQQRRRDVIIAAPAGWEPRDGDTIEIPREGRRYTVAGEARAFTVAGATLAWRLTTVDGR